MISQADIWVEENILYTGKQRVPVFTKLSKLEGNPWGEMPTKELMNSKMYHVALNTQKSNAQTCNT